jgi:histo-blood group ABO system transferase
MLTRIYTVHDKEPEFLRIQIPLCRKFVQDDFELVVLNNAANLSQADEIAEICEEFGVAHWMVPDQHHENANIACSYPLDYLMSRFFRSEADATVSVIIDSDMFLLRPVSFIAAVGSAEIAAVFQSRGRYEHDSPRNHVHYLWNGLVIFNHACASDFSKIVWACSASKDSPYYPAELFDNESRIEGEWVDVGGATHEYLKGRPVVKYIDWERVSASRDNLHLIPSALRLIYLPFYHSESAASDFLLNGAIFHYRAGSNWNQLRDHLIRAKKVILDRLVASALGVSEDGWLDWRARSGRREGSRVLVGICSCRAYFEKRQAVRETWLAGCHAPIVATFFVGNGEAVMADLNYGDVVVVNAPDDYESLPAKVMAFFRHALDHFEFDWIFKCDDDTYLAPERLLELTRGDHDFAGNEFIETSGYASGGAGYLLSRALVELLVKDVSLAATGAEDMIISGAAVMKGARGLITNRLCWDGKRIPRRDNDVISSHWLAPDQMRAIHTLLTQKASSQIDFVGGSFRSRICFHENGAFCQQTGPGYGIWEIDDEANLVLEFGPNREHELCAVGSLIAESPNEALKIGVLVIATGKYRIFVDPLVQSINENFLPQYEKTVFVFSDSEMAPQDGVTVLRITNRPWPEMTLFRYAIFRDHAGAFEGVDYLFYLDADMRIVGYVGSEILSDLTAVLHPTFAKATRSEFSYEDNPTSQAYVSENEGARYFCGGVQGGRTAVYLEAVRVMAERIDVDSSAGIVAKWHDESHWNRYLIDHPPTKVLSPSYCCPEGASLDRPVKIVALDKDHTEFRGASTVWPKTIVARLTGGLGNQLFGYANGLSLARYFGASLEVTYGGSSRGFMLDRFGISLTPEREDDAFRFCDLHGYLPGHERKMREEIIAGNAERVLVEGYFQNERYFQNVAREVRSRFRVSPCLPIPSDGRIPVGLQIRRGDYVGDPKFDLCAESYFRDAMAIVKSLVTSPRLYVISDDLEWCRSWLGHREDVFIPDSQSESEALQTMMACKAMILSNSSFGWWGAWLSGAEIVVAPDPWLGDQHWDCLPSRWIRIPAAGLLESRSPM